MSIVAVTPPSPLVTLEEAKHQLRVDHDEEDSLIQLYIDAASSRLDGPSGILGVAYSTQTWDLFLDEFPSEAIFLGVGPVVYVNSVSYLDSTGDTLIINPSTYTLDKAYDSFGWVIPATKWPIAGNYANAVQVRWVAGQSSVPAQVKQAALLLVAHFYRNRESTTPESIKELPMGMYDLLSNVRRVFI